MTWHYEIRLNGKVIYVGLTTQTLSQRLRQHWETARTNPRDEFHKYLINCNENEIKITTSDYPEPIKHRNKADAEKFENQHIKSYFVDGKNTLLNSKIEVKAFKQREPIKLTEIDNDKLLTLDKLNQIKNATNKKLTPTIYDDTKNKIIQVYFTKNDKKARPKTFRYSKCGIDEVMKKVNHYIEKEQEIHQNQFTDDIIYK